jgi:2-iminobutanoate/2-iminopropanoate deaminase
MQLQNAPEAPGAIGPYSHAVLVGDLVFCSGQTPIDPRTMELLGDDIQVQTKQVLLNLEAVLASLGLDLSNVIKTTVFLATMEDFQGMNTVYAEMFGAHRPARTTVAVKENPLGALVEIECIAEVRRRSQDPEL